MDNAGEWQSTTHYVYNMDVARNVPESGELSPLTVKRES
jgi:hypothetical protein